MSPNERTEEQDKAEETFVPRNRAERKRFEKQMKKQGGVHVDKQMKPYDRVAAKVRTIVYSEKGISCIVYVAGEQGKYAGGLIGEPTEIADALFHAAKENKAVYVIMDEVVKQLKDKGYHQPEKLFNLAKLCDENVIPKKLYNILDKHGIYDLAAIQEHKESDVLKWSGLGGQTFKILQEVMKERGLKFKKEGE